MNRKRLLSLFLILIFIISSGCSASAESSAAVISTEENTFGSAYTGEPAAEGTVVTGMPDTATAAPDTATEAPAVQETEPEADGAENQTSMQQQSTEQELPQPAETAEAVQEDAPQSSDETAADRAQQLLDGLTLEEKVAQLFIIVPEALTDVPVVTAAGDTTRAAFNEIPVGGFIYMGQNLEDEAQVTEMLSNVQRISQDRIGLPVFTAVDEEGGTVARIGGNDSFDVPRIGDMCDIGAEGDSEKAYEVGTEIGQYLSRMGFNLDFAPDADVLSNPDNQVVKYRSFGSDPELVADMALAVSRGLRENGVLSCCKHFPGHGATEGDTHEGYAYTSKTLSELQSCELIPFQRWIQQDGGMIMVGHISLPEILDESTPASLSYELITGLLRDDMQFDGLIITDALGMGAVSQSYTSAEAAVMAFQAGADLLLMPENFHEAYDGVLSAVTDGSITEERLNASVLRILNAKLLIG